MLVQVKAGTLTISARNPIWSIRAWADIAAGEKELSCVVNSNVFSQIVDRMPGDTIFLSTSKAKKTLVIQSEKLKVAIPYFQDYNKLNLFQIYLDQLHPFLLNLLSLYIHLHDSYHMHLNNFLYLV